MVCSQPVCILFREFLGTACCTYGQSNTTNYILLSYKTPEWLFHPQVWGSITWGAHHRPGVSGAGTSHGDLVTDDGCSSQQSHCQDNGPPCLSSWYYKRFTTRGCFIWGTVYKWLWSHSDLKLNFLSHNDIAPLTIFLSSLSINSLAPLRCGCDIKFLIFKLISRKDTLSITCEIALRWMSQIMAWCSQATSHYLSPCWRRSTSPYRPLWVKMVLVVEILPCEIHGCWRWKDLVIVGARASTAMVLIYR